MLVADRYRLEAAIGRGGMGEVWRASDEVLGRAVAVKLLLDDGSNEQATARFRLEAQTAARLNHPNVVTVFDFGSWSDRFYLVMELVEGVSLAQDLTASGRFSPRRVAGIAGQAAAGMAAAHRQGVIHRDIKPGNLMQDADGTVKIGDFGIARFVDDASAALTSAGHIVGTSFYLAPERALGRTAGPASDVYALGCVLYQLLVGEPPFRADTAASVLHLHVAVPPTPPSQHRPELPGAFEEQLLRMLAKQPEERPTAQEVADWFSGPAWQSGAQQNPDPAAASTGTVYALPQVAAQQRHSHSAASGQRRRAAQGRRPAARSSSSRLPAPLSATAPVRARGRTPSRTRKHRTLIAAVAGIGILVAFTFLGMALFSPDDSAAQSPTPAPSQSASGSPTPSFPSVAFPTSTPTTRTPVAPATHPAPPAKAAPPKPAPKRRPPGPHDHHAGHH